mgnify:CR=1 FL=1
MTVFKNRMQKRQPSLYQVNLYPLPVLAAALLVSRACLNCDFIIQRNFVDVNIKQLFFVGFVTMHKVRGVYLCIMHNAQKTE